MKFDFSKVLEDLDGSPLTDKGEAVSLRKIAVNALLAVYADEPNLEGTKKLERYELASRVHRSNGACEISPEELAELRRLILKAFPPVVVGPAIGALSEPVKFDA